MKNIKIEFPGECIIPAGYEITERTIDRYGQFLFLADIEVNTW